MIKEKELKTVFVVTGMAGEYEDTTTSVIAVYESREDAEAFINNKKNWKSDSQKIAIDSDTYYELQSEHSRVVFDEAYRYPDDVPDYDEEFSDQRIHWMFYVGKMNKKLCKKIQKIVNDIHRKTYMYVNDEEIISEIESDDSINDNETQLFKSLLDKYNEADDMYNDNIENEHFKKWLIEEKGYSKDVIEASIVVNDSDDYSDYNTFYYIDEVTYYGKKE